MRIQPLPITSRTALLIVDMQNAIDQPFWSKYGPRNHKNAELAALRLLDTWRATARPRYHVRHDSIEPHSTYRPGRDGNRFKPGFEPAAGEMVIPKHTGSAFVGTGLESILRRGGEETLVVAGVITNNSVETTVRHAATLGFAVFLAEDACFTFARPDWRGVVRGAAEVHAMTLANIDGEYCRVVRSAEILAAAGSSLPILPYYEQPPEYLEWDSTVISAADSASELIAAAAPDATVHHAGSTAVPGCPGTGIIDLLVTCPEGNQDRVCDRLASIGFQFQPEGDAFFEGRCSLAGVLPHDGALWRIHARVIAEGSLIADAMLKFRDRLRADREVAREYAAHKRRIVSQGIQDTAGYANAKSAFITALP